MRNPEKGFSLIELLIVVAIILIIAAIAIPNLLQSRQRANESSAAGSLRTINTSEVTYQTTYLVGFAHDLAKLGAPLGTTTYDCTKAGLIDNVLSQPPNVKSGYIFAIAAPPVAPVPGTINTGCATPGETDYAYTATAQVNQGRRGYYTDSTGVIRFCVADPTTPCTATFNSDAMQ